MTRIRSLRLLIAVGILGTTFALPLRAAEKKLTWYPKLNHRQLGARYTLALELNRRLKTFFVCGPNKTDCFSTREIGWRKPYIIARSGNLVGRSYNVIDTSSPNRSGPVSKSLASELKTVPIYPAAVAWEKLSPKRPIW